MSEPETQLETVNVRRVDGVATVELNRPEALNAWNTQLGLDLLAALRGVAADEAVRAVLLTGAGRAFSSGADLKDFSGGETTADGRPDIYKTLTERYHPIMQVIREMEKPVLASVNGPAVGIGCSLALCCDLIVAGESAYFLLAFVNIGLVPDGGSSLFVPTRIGMARAILQKPGWLFLDEATSALDEDAEAMLYRLLRERLPETAIVSIGHRESLRQFHDRFMELTGDGSGPRTLAEAAPA